MLVKFRMQIGHPFHTTAAPFCHSVELPDDLDEASLNNEMLKWVAEHHSPGMHATMPIKYGYQIIEPGGHKIATYLTCERSN